MSTPKPQPDKPLSKLVNLKKNATNEEKDNRGSIGSKLNWVEILVVGIILTTLGWLSVTVFNMNGMLSKVEAQSHEAMNDIAGIKQVLPSIAKAIAQSEVKSELNIAMVTSKPFKTKEGSLVKTFNVIDTKSEKLLTYTVDLKNEQDAEKTLLFKGGVFSLQARPVSFSTLVEYSNQLDQPVTISPEVDTENSYILYLHATKYEDILGRYLGQPKITKINAKSENWTELAIELKQNKSWVVGN